MTKELNREINIYIGFMQSIVMPIGGGMLMNTKKCMISSGIGRKIFERKSEASKDPLRREEMKQASISR